MGEETKIILQLLSDGKITAEEAANLIKALGEHFAGVDVREQTEVRGNNTVGDISRRARLQAKVVAREAKETLRVQMQETKEVLRDQLHEAKERIKESVQRVKEEAGEENRHGGVGGLIGNLLRGLSGTSFTWQEEMSGEIEGSGVVKVMVSGVNGSIDIGASPDEKWHLSVEKCVYAEDRDQAREQAKRLYTVESGENVFYISAKQAFGQRSVLHFRLLWPQERNCDLDIGSANGSVKINELVAGNVRVATTNGKIEVHTKARAVNLTSINGRISIFGCAANISCNAVNGSIAVLCRVPDEGAWSLKTVNGGIKVRLGEAPALGIKVSASNVHGRVECNLPQVDTNIEKHTASKVLTAVRKGDFSRWLTIAATSVHGRVVIDPLEEGGAVTQAE